MKNNREASLFTFTKQFKEFIKADINDHMLFVNFFKNIEVVDFSDKNVVLYLNAKISTIEKTSAFFNDNIQRAIVEVFQKKIPYKIINVSLSEYNEINKEIAKESNKYFSNLKKKNTINNFNDKYTFDKYVKSQFNKEVVDICKSSIENLNNINPIYIQAQSGLGKTHILHAVGHEYLKTNRSAVYINPGNFTRDVAIYLQENNQIKITKLYNFYCDVDLLMFDDFQIFGVGQKKATLQFIFQIIDSRIQNDKQTIFASEATLQSLKGVFDNRIITRISGGFQTQIKRPSNEDWNKILDYLLEEVQIKRDILDSKSKDFIIRNHSTSIRELSGAISRVSFYKKDIINAKYVYSVIVNAFKEVIKNKENITPDLIVDTVGKYYKVLKRDILGKTRKKEIIIARHISMMMIRLHLELSLEEIGKYFKKDHSTVVNALKKLENQENDSSIKNAFSFLNEEIYKLK